MHSRTPLRALLALALAASGLGVALVLAAGRDVVPPRAAAAPAAVSDPLSIVHAWDARRARAWARGDPEALARLYLPGSSAGRADVRLLRTYLERGLVVRELRMQVLAAHVVRSGPAVLRVRVIDRLAHAVASGGSASSALPATRPAHRLLVLRQVGGHWRMASVRAVG